MKEVYLILSLILIGLAFLIWLFFRKKRKNYLEQISGFEAGMKKTERYIRDIKEHSEEMVDKKKGYLVRDVEELKENLKSMQSTLDAADESARRNSILLSNIRYTLRTNLNDILGFSYLLGNDFAKKEDTEMYEYSENIRKSGDSLMHLLNNIIDISRIEANTFNLSKQNCDLISLLNELEKEYEPVAKQKGLQLFFQNEDIPLFSTDSEALKHILSNLLDNAIKYTGSGFVKMIVKAEKEQIVIFVKDTGVGIDKAYQDEIFEPFRSQTPGYSKTTYHGAGLGLPLVKQMLALMGGNIDLKSEKAGGTNIKVTIPLTKPIQENFPAGRKKSQSDGKKIINLHLKHNLNKVLVIDNDRLNNMLIRKMLPDIPQLSFATSSRELENIINNSGNSGEPFDIVIMNIDFVKGGDKFSTRKEMQKNYAVFKKTPFVAMSDILDIRQREKMLKEGFKAYIDKPISKEKLINTVNLSIG